MNWSPLGERRRGRPREYSDEFIARIKGCKRAGIDRKIIADKTGLSLAVVDRLSYGFQAVQADPALSDFLERWLKHPKDSSIKAGKTGG